MDHFKNKCKKALAFLLLFVLALQAGALPAEAAEIQYHINIRVFVDGTEIGEIPALDDSYENNLYVSLKGVAYALNGTGKAFAPAVERRKITITTGKDYTSRPAVWDREMLDTTIYASSGKYELNVDEEERKYYSFILPRDAGYDAFLKPVSLAMLFDMEIKVTEDRLDIDTAKPFSVTAEEMEESGYLQGVNALLIGDGSTGDVYYQYDKDEVVPIASTTKLMTYLVFMDAVSRGECSLEDSVVLSEKAEKLSGGSDGVIPMVQGKTADVKDLLYGMLLLSSNECALTIAEYVAGSEEAFVVRMNDKAAELGLENARFYNCHGLPYFEDQLMPAKVQNHMTAEEMFRLASVLMDTYPQVTDFTSTKTFYMETLGMKARNSNAVLYNMDCVAGLKTGTTNKAGACLVTCAPILRDGKIHNLISVLFGAEGDANRGTVSELSIRYALAALAEREDVISTDPGEEDRAIPEDPEKVIRKLLNGLIR